MGAAVVRRLVGAGHSVRTWNRTAAAVEALLTVVGPGRFGMARTPRARGDQSDGRGVLGRVQHAVDTGHGGHDMADLSRVPPRL
jgi:hypothetical protein